MRRHLHLIPRRSCGGSNCPALSEGRSEGECLTYVRFFKIGEVTEQFVSRAPSRPCLNDHANCHAHTSNTRLAAHDFGIERDAVET